jgi:hypothetical protein
LHTLWTKYSCLQPSFTRSLPLRNLHHISTLSLSRKESSLTHYIRELRVAGRPSWIIPSLHVGFIGLVLNFQSLLSQRHSCKLFQLFPQPKLVGHQDLTGTQPPTWLLQWLTRLLCILGLTQWVRLPALRRGGLMLLSWVALNCHLRRCTNIPSLTTELSRSRHRRRLPSLVLATFSHHQVLYTAT